MLATHSFENGKFEGLNWIEGEVKKMQKTHERLKIPHMGWSNLELKKETGFIKKLKTKLEFEKFPHTLFIVIIFLQKMKTR